jgi:hypothetical protein
MLPQFILQQRLLTNHNPSTFNNFRKQENYSPENDDNASSYNNGFSDIEDICKKLEIIESKADHSLSDEDIIKAKRVILTYLKSCLPEERMKVLYFIKKSLNNSPRIRSIIERIMQ